MFKNLRRMLIGQPLDTCMLENEKYSNFKGLAILSSDALSSVAYAGEEILRVLIPVLGLSAFNFLSPITLGIILLIFIVSFSYRTLIAAYPNSSGGAYIVAKDTMGIYPGLVAGAALLFGYILTVAVSVSAGVAAITSAFHPLIPYTILITVLIIIFLTIMNLRGITESANFFTYPTYFFIVGIVILIVVGLAKIFIYGAPPKPNMLPIQSSVSLTTAALTFVLLKAFSSGCSAMTGVEAISNAVPAFQKPESKNAQKVLLRLSILLFIMFGGLALLTRLYWVLPTNTDTVISVVAAKIFGRNIIYYIFQVSTALILILAANTSYAGFPMLASLIASDYYAPKYLCVRGDRLSYSNGILALALISSVLVIIFKGSVNKLIPLYAVGVFISFTLAQAGMLKRWVTKKEGKWQLNILINGLGALTTGIVTINIIITKFFSGAWISIILIPITVAFFIAIKRHYLHTEREIQFSKYKPMVNAYNTVVVPVAELSKVVAHTIDYARTIGSEVKAVHISTSEESTAKLLKRWNQWEPGIELIIIPSPFRAIVEPLCDYINQLEQNKQENEIITVLLPGIITKRWWHKFLHNYTGLVLQNLLVLRNNIVVASVPHHLKN